MTIVLRPHQQMALDALRRSFASGHRRPMLQAPTGFGKTIVAAEIAQGILNRRRRCIFVVPFLSLIDQTITRFEQCGITEVGVIQGNHPRGDARASIQVCSRDTLSARNLHPHCDLVVVDEAHINSKWLFGWMKSPVAPKL